MARKTRKRKGPLNLLGTKLKPCSSKTGKTTEFYRTGCCTTGPDDTGTHVVCAVVTDDFLQFTKSQGNDLITPNPPFFPGLVAGDRWCLCALRWYEAYKAGHAPPLLGASTNRVATRFVPLRILLKHLVEA